MTNRELLELAAAAIGVKVAGGRACEGLEGRLLHPKAAGLLCMNDLYWNPLADDGDAFRLAVRAAQMYGFCRFERALVIAMATAEGHPADLCAIIRRAIVSAVVALVDSHPSQELST